MATYINFYETIAEARMRLLNTVVMYDNEPYFVVAITDHMSDGVFRIYLEPFGLEGYTATYNSGPKTLLNFPPYAIPHDSSMFGPAMDQFIESQNTFRIIRKMMNSPKFNKFRPFPLGMCNTQGSVIYTQRMPKRKSDQGLTNNMLLLHTVGLQKESMYSPIWGTPAFRDTIMGVYPTIQECFTNLSDDAVVNKAVAFSRELALVAGPADTFFLAVQGDIVGVFTQNDPFTLRLDRKFKFYAEQLSEVFPNVF